MADDTRNVLHISIRDGDRTLKNASKVDLSIYDDKLPISTGLLRREITNSPADTEIEIDFTEFGLANVKSLLLYSTVNLRFRINVNTDPMYELVAPTDLPSGQVINENIIKAGALVWRTNGVTKLYFYNNQSATATLYYMAAGLAS